MRFFIQVVDGQPHQHPILEDNMREAFPGIDLDNLPEGFAEFIRLDPADVPLGYYEAHVEQYVWDGAFVRDNWGVRPMTTEEHDAKFAAGVAMFETSRAALIERGVYEWFSAPTQEIADAWLMYIAELDALVCEDPAGTQFPRPPRILEDGTVVTTNSSGVAPNVIG
jgi:hypothetical protein